MVSNERIICVNGKPTSLTNIFDAINPQNPNYWCYVSEKETGRPISDILNEWLNNGVTYYYLDGIKTNFELREMCQ